MQNSQLQNKAVTTWPNCVYVYIYTYTFVCSLVALLSGYRWPLPLATLLTTSSTGPRFLTFLEKGILPAISITCNTWNYQSLNHWLTDSYTVCTERTRLLTSLIVYNVHVQVLNRILTNSHLRPLQSAVAEFSFQNEDNWPNGFDRGLFKEEAEWIVITNT